MTAPLCPILQGGTWSQLPNLATGEVFNPSRGEVIARVPMCGAPEVDQTVRAAHEAFLTWREVPPVERARILFRYKALLEQEFAPIAKGITREHGKTAAEARGDLRRGIEVVEFACGIPSLLMGESIENVARGIDCDTIRQPIGVCVGITPFNFPAMVPLWMFPLAIACGNTFVLKPSEKTPLTAIRLAELLIEAGLPAGVFNIVHGGRDCVDALLTHPLVQAISFVGSTPVARHVRDTGMRHGKRVQAAGGAKNFILIMPDADVTPSVTGLVEAAFGCAGERCMAGSTALLVGGAERKVLPELVKAATSMTIGPTDDRDDVQLGPVISAAHRDRVSSLIETGSKEGARIAADGRGVKVDGGGFFLGATVLDAVQADMTVMREEVFGPVLSVMEMDDLDAAIAVANQSTYGNGASIFTRSGGAARQFRHQINSGMVGINVGVPAPMAFFPFSGWGDSFFGDLHLQGREGISFYTRQKVTTSRWFAEGEGSIWNHK